MEVILNTSDEAKEYMIGKKDIFVEIIATEECKRILSTYPSRDFLEDLARENIAKLVLANTITYLANTITYKEGIHYGSLYDLKLANKNLAIYSPRYYLRKGFMWNMDFFEMVRIKLKVVEMHTLII